jgi:hypothetical protein
VPAGGLDAAGRARIRAVALDLTLLPVGLRGRAERACSSRSEAGVSRGAAVRGAAILPVALAAVAVRAALAAAVAELARLEVVLARNRRATAEALDAADRCVAETVAGVAPGWDLDALLNGPDGVRATADDGQVALPAGCTGRARPAPGTPLPPRAVVQIEGRAGRGRRTLDALIGLDVAPGVPPPCGSARPRRRARSPAR